MKVKQKGQQEKVRDGEDELEDEEEEEGYGSGGDILDDDIIRIRVKVCPIRMLTVFSPFS